MKNSSIKKTIVRAIASRKGEVILRRELDKFGSKSQVTRAVADIVLEGGLVKIGYGVYAKAKINMFSGKPTPRVVLEDIVDEAFKRLGIKFVLGRAAREYNNRLTTQIPAHFVLDTGNRKISRTMLIAGRKLRYENDFQKQGAKP